MEFNFRATDEHASNYNPRPSNVGYFTEQALRAGYLGSNSGYPAAPVQFFPNPRDARETYQRELEKERIREEIIAAEIARKRMLEAEVRTELILEREMLLAREMEMRRGGGISFFPGSIDSPPMPLEPRLPLLPQSGGRQLEERLGMGMGMSFEERVGYQAQQRRMDGLGTLCFHRNPEPRITEPRITEISTPEVKPEGNFSGAKRKAVTPPTVGISELPLIASRKKAKEEWSCAICQVSATSQHGLNDHLQGKKHKSKEAALVAQRTGKNYAIGLFPKKPLNPIKKVEVTTSEKPKEEKKLEGNSLKIVSVVKSDNEDIQQSIDSALQVFAEESKTHKSGSSEAIKRNNGGDSEQSKRKRKDPSNFKYWCEMCRVGAFSLKVMNKHRGGKKHTTRLVERNPNAVITMTPKVMEAKVKPVKAVAEVEKEDNPNAVITMTPKVMEAKVKPIAEVEKEEGNTNAVITMTPKVEKEENMDSLDGAEKVEPAAAEESQQSAA